MERTQKVRENIARLLASRDRKGLTNYLKETHYADLAEVLPLFDLPEQIAILSHVDYNVAAQVLYELDRSQVASLLEGLGVHRTALILQEMSSDDAADLIGELDEETKAKYLGMMPSQDAEDVQELLEYEPDTAGGIMTTEFVFINKEMTAEEAIAHIRRTAPGAETVYYVYVVNDRNQLVGVISLRELILADPSKQIKDIMRTKVISLNVHTDQEEVARVVAKYDFLALPIVDDDGVLVGIVTVDDVLDVIEEEATEDYLSLANVKQESRYLELSDFERAGRRLPWLITLLFGSLLAGSVIQLFEGTLQAVTALAFFMPVIAGGPGNVATQTLAVVVRGLGTGEVNPKHGFYIILKEARVGLLVGIISGLVLATVAIIWQDNFILGLVVGISLAASMLVATVLGSLFPFFISRIGVDPALASGPFITTLMDATSMLIYFGMASAIWFGLGF
ncbi:MAG: magnesium transporter [Peptococcaceae bacterium]|nr:magnesium transporter [Peptococcaceae bacterium]